MKIIGLEIADVCTLFVYLAGITAIGVWMGRTIHNTTDFFVGGRRFGKLLSTFFAFGAGTHSDQAVSVAAKTYKTGMSGIWYQWLWLFVTPFYWLIAPIQRRCRAITTGDYFEARFARSVAMLFVFIGILNLMVNIGTMLKGSGAVIDATTGGEVNEDWAIALMTILFVTYGVVGGLAAAVVTDFIQGLLTIVFSFILLPIAIHVLGGFSGLHQKVTDTFAQHPAPGVPEADAMWSLVAPGEITLFYVVVIAINALVGFVAQPHTLPGANASRTEREAQIGSVTGNLIKRLCTIAWCLLGMCAFVMFRGMTEDQEIDQAFGLVAHELLPTVLPGLIGIFIASLLASIMSSCDAFMITCSGLFTHNLYRPLTGNRKSESHYVNVGRVAAAVVVAGGVFFAYRFESVLKGLELFWKLSAMMGIAFWAGLFWRRATTAGAWAGTLVAFAAMLFTGKIALVDWDFNKSIANSYVGSVSADVENDLYEKKLTPALKLAMDDQVPFAESGIEVDHQAGVEVIDKKDVGRRWVIQDGSSWYTCVDLPGEDKDDRQIDVYNNTSLWTMPEDEDWQDELNHRGPSAALRAKFAGAGIELPADAVVFVVDDRHGPWLIREDDRLLATVTKMEHGVEAFTATEAFSIDPELERDLDSRERTVSDALHEVFAAHEASLSDEAKMVMHRTEKIGQRFLVSDGERVYTLVGRAGQDGETAGFDLYVNALPTWLLWKGQLRLPWQMIIYLTAGFAALIVVSLLTKPPSSEQLDRFYNVVRTPVQPGEIIDEPFTLPKGLEPAAQKKLINHPNWEIQIPTRRGIVGFLVVTAIVVGLVGTVMVLVRIGA